MSLFGETLRQVDSDLVAARRVLKTPKRPPPDYADPGAALADHVELYEPDPEKRRRREEERRREYEESRRAREAWQAWRREQEARRRATVQAVRAVMQVVVSFIVLGGGLYVLLEGNEQAGQAAAGTMGIVLGYWLR